MIRIRIFSISFYSILLLLLMLTILPTPCFATYSIVAVDTITGAVGGAGASCVAEVFVINDIIEGVGAVHSQSWYLPANQDIAHDQLASGATPDEIMDWVTNHDVENMPELRQYGAVTLIGPGASASYTGLTNSNWAGHRNGPGYAIQGNILLGEEIVNNMEAAFWGAAGPLEAKLWAAMEAANVPGADTRCTSCNKPAISAFIKVVHLGDGGKPYLEQVISNTSCGLNPIDFLRSNFNSWKMLRLADPDSSEVSITPIYLRAGSGDSAMITIIPRNNEGQAPVEGAVVSLLNYGDGILREVQDNGDETFSGYVIAPDEPGADTIVATINTYGADIYPEDKAFITYFLCGDANGDIVVNVGDAVYMINYVFKGGAPPVPPEAGDANCDGLPNVGDAVFLINYVFRQGPKPCSKCPQ